jgi:nitronate monooxygenase
MGGMWRTTDLTRLLGCDVPVVQAPLGGGPGTPELAAAVCGAGGFGVLGGGYLDPDDLGTVLARTRSLTDRPFGVNLFLAPPPRRAGSAAAPAARAALARVAAGLGLDAAVPDRPRGLPDPDEQLEVVLSSDARLVTFAFGAPTRAAVTRLHDAGCLVGGTAQSAADARELAGLGVDVVVAQGAEAGGHRGGRSGAGGPGDVPGLVALVPAVVDAVDVPVMAAGGIADGRGVAAALVLGAQAAALGTAFLRTPEAGTGPAYRQALAGADETSTVTTRAFSGRPARGLPNAYVRAFDGDEPVEVPDFPVMNYLSRPLRTASAEAGTAEAQSLWAGQGVGLARELPAAELVAAVVAETEKALARVSR